MSTAGYSTPVYADPAATMGGGTPLILAVSRAGKSDDYHVTVKLQLLQAYERTIFELQQQLVHYKTLLQDLLPRNAQQEQLRLEGTPINEASVRILDSIASSVAAKLPLRGLDEPDES